MAVQEKKRKAKGWLYALGSFLLKLFYIPVYRVKVIGRENLPQEGPVLMCCNHVAVKDPVLLGIALPRQVFYMAKEELFRNRFIGGLLRKLGAFPVARGTGGTDALENAYRLLAENAVVGVFIEGHRSKDGELQRPKTGAALLQFRTKATVVPACITGWDGRRPAPFKPTLIRIGKPISNRELAISDESSLQLRRASRTIMGAIAALREESLRDLGIALPAGEKQEQEAE